MSKPSKTLAERIAAEVFSIGSELGERPHRISYKIGTYPNSEQDCGGLCESALARVIEKVMREELSKESKRGKK